MLCAPSSMIIQRHGVWRANIRAQRQAQDVTPKQDSTPEHATCVSTLEFNVSRSGNPSSPPPPRVTRTTLNSAEGLGLPQSCRSHTEGAQALLRLCHSTQQPGLRTHRGGTWWQGGGWDTGRSVAFLDCHIELRKAQPWQEPIPNCASGSSGAEGTQPRSALLSHFPSDVPWAAQGAQSTPPPGCGSSWGTSQAPETLLPR